MRADWRELERLCVVSPYQTLGFCQAWMETIGKAEGAVPLIAIARLGGEPAALLPLAQSHFGLLRCAGFQGGRTQVAERSPHYHRPHPNTHDRSPHSTEENGSIASVFRRMLRCQDFSPRESPRCLSSTERVCHIGEFCTVTPSTRTPLQWSKMISFGRGWLPEFHDP